MSWQDVLGAVDKELPPFNDYMLKQCRKDQVSQCAEYAHTAFHEAIKLFNGLIKYHGYKVLSPDKQIEYMLENPLIRGRFNVQISELQLLEFTFEYEGQLLHAHLFLPYLHNGSVIVNDTAYYIQLAIIERIIYRTLDCVVIKVMRSPLHFWRTEQFAYTSVEGKSFYDAIITIKAHYRTTTRSKKDLKTAMLLYLLSVRNFDGTLASFGLTMNDIWFTSAGEAINDVVTFKCKEDVYLRVRADIMQNVTYRRVVASLVYVLTYFKFYSLEDLTFVPKQFADGNVYQMMLGRTIFGARYKLTLACSQAQTHLSSLNTYLDPITKLELKKQNINCDDIYDLFVQVFINLDSWLINHAPNNLYEKKIGVLELLMSDIIRSLFTKFYDVMKKQKTLNQKVVRSLFRMSSKRITAIHKSPLVRNASSYGDNELLSLMGKKVRQPANQDNAGKRNINLITAREHRFDPSFPVIESPLSIPSSSPGISGSINPYAPITVKDLYFYKPNYAADIDELAPYLPSR